jgi:low affinity Fe/Cu permease
VGRAQGWDRAAQWVSNAMGTPYAFFAAAASVAVWLAVGAPMRWDATWLLIMGTGASIMAYLMVFVVQTSQNRDTRVVQAQLAHLLGRVDAADARLTEILRRLEEGRAGQPVNGSAG